MKTILLISASVACVVIARAQAPSATLAGTRASTPGVPETVASSSPSAAPETSPAASVSPSGSPVQSAPPQLNEILFKNFKARSIGPATMGGRVSDIAIDPRNPAVFFVGLSTGGLFKTGDNGVTFDSVFDKQPVQSIGAVAVAPSDSDVVWVGTGEPTDRNSAEWGNGVYRSTDGGMTWQHVGLDTSRSIGRMMVHPKSPETAYVAALGNLWADGGERGVFKTMDGGKSWKLVLAGPAPHSAGTGACDLAMAPDNPEIIYAAMYARQRKPWSFTYGVSATGGEDVGGIFKSTNGGGTWKKCTAGLPTLTGKIGLAVTPVNPKIVMAVVQSDEGGASDFQDIHSRRGGVFRSEDAGETWKRVSDPSLGGPGDQRINAIVEASGKSRRFVAGGFSDHDGAVWITTDGARWEKSQVGLGGPGDQVVNSVAGGKTLTAVGSDTSTGDSDAAVWTSTDGIRSRKCEIDVSRPIVGCPPRQSETSVEVPPMSNVRMFS